jgi:hypothetical protein
VLAKKMSESKPRETRRKHRDDIKTRVGCLSWEKARGIPAYCPSGVRRRRGMSLVVAFVWNVGTYCMMRRENPISGSPTKGESIDAGSRGGPSRSSDEVPAMGLE